MYDDESRIMIGFIVGDLFMVHYMKPKIADGMTKKICSDTDTAQKRKIAQYHFNWNE